jgi:hypothetical protein
VNNYLSTFTAVSSDTIIVLAIVALLFFIAFQFGKGYITSIIVSIYISAFLYINAFFVQKLVFVGNEASKLFWNHLGIFLLFFIPVFYLLRNVVSGDYSRRGKFVGAGLLAVATAGLVLAIFYHVIPLTPVYNFSAGIDKLFATDTMFTFWLLIPLLVLFF